MMGLVGGPGWRVSGGETAAVTSLFGAGPASGSFPVVARSRLLLQQVCVPIDNESCGGRCGSWCQRHAPLGPGRR